MIVVVILQREIPSIDWVGMELVYEVGRRGSEVDI